MSASFRNAVQRRNHRERAQPEAREKWGLLEKHKDYSLRAKDHNLKKRKLRQLQQKVLEKNPDEFYFGMMSQSGPTSFGKQRTGTKNGDRGNEVLGQEKVRLLKTQDLGYVRMIRNSMVKEVEGLRMKVVGIRGEGRKVVFVEDVGELGERLREVESSDGWEDDEEDDEEEDLEMTEEEKLKELREMEHQKIKKRLEAAEERLKVLTQVEQELEVQRGKMGKKPSVGGVTKAGKKFKIRERKR